MGSIKPKDTEEIQKLSGRDIKQRCLKGSERSWGRARDRGEGKGIREARARLGGGREDATRECGASGRGWQRQGAREGRQARGWGDGAACGWGMESRGGVARAGEDRGEILEGTGKAWGQIASGRGRRPRGAGRGGSLAGAGKGGAPGAVGVDPAPSGRPEGPQSPPRTRAGGVRGRGRRGPEGSGRPRGRGRGRRGTHSKTKKRMVVVRMSSSVSAKTPPWPASMRRPPQ